MSAIIAMAFNIIEPKDLNIASLDLDLPPNVMGNLKDTLKPYLEAIQIDGYEGKKKRKTFLMGNTGRNNLKPIKRRLSLL